MVNYSIIQNEHLRQLVILSESIHSLPADQLEVMIQRIAALPEEGQLALIKTLEDEQQKIKAAKLAKGITPEMELKQMEENSLKVTAIKYEFETGVRKENEKIDAKQSEEEAEKLILNI